MNFITFGSHANYIDAGKRLLEQGKRCNIFTEYTLFTHEDLEKDKDFWSKHHKFVTQNSRGCGYWLWKPYIIKKSMEKMNEGDILLYLDCGCEVDPLRNSDMLKCIEKVKTDKLLGTLTYMERDWNKMDLVEKIGSPEYLDTPQHAAGVILFLVCEETKTLVNEWYTLACDYHNIDDSPSVLKNLECFQEHRHDQSIFSLLTKKYNLFSNQGLDEAVFYLRNRTGTSSLVYY
jgi:hypothetical protein